MYMYAIFIVHSDVCVHTLYTFRSQDKQQKQLYTFKNMCYQHIAILRLKGCFCILVAERTI